MKRIVTICLISMTLFLSACGEAQKDEELLQFMTELRPQQALSMPAKLTVLSDINASMQTSRDPFAVYLRDDEESRALAPERGGAREALEAFPLRTLTMVGSLQQKDKLWALVLAPDNIVYRISEGSRVGQDYGLVTEVTADSIQIVETIRLARGWQQRERVLVLAG
ncbi:MAG: pilus assembly protein PilP [Gammaproteobacteria bacterium]